VYIQEYPKYGTDPDGSSLDLNNAFYNVGPYAGIWEDEIVIPSGIIEIGEELHACIKYTNRGLTLVCYKLDTEKQGQRD
jgi:hypothetical protein